MASCVTEIRRNFTNFAHNFTEAEVSLEAEKGHFNVSMFQVKVREATSNDPACASTMQFMKIAGDDEILQGKNNICILL